VSDGRRRRRGRTRRFLAWSGWLVLGLVLVGKLVLDGAGESSVSLSDVFRPELLSWVAFWLPLALCGGMSIAGMYWASRAYDRAERTSLLWLRRGFGLSLVGAVVLALARMDRDMFPRESLAATASVILAVQTTVFAAAALREHRRGELAESRRHRSRERSQRSQDSVRVESTGRDT
jgi:hypothetical protein